MFQNAALVHYVPITPPPRFIMSSKGIMVDIGAVCGSPFGQSQYLVSCVAPGI